MKVELTGLADGVYVGERGAKDDSKFGRLEKRQLPLFRNGQKRGMGVLDKEAKSLEGLSCMLQEVEGPWPLSIKGQQLSPVIRATHSHPHTLSNTPCSSGAAHV